MAIVSITPRIRQNAEAKAVREQFNSAVGIRLSIPQFRETRSVVISILNRINSSCQTVKDNADGPKAAFQNRNTGQSDKWKWSIGKQGGNDCIDRLYDARHYERKREKHDCSDCRGATNSQKKEK